MSAAAAMNGLRVGDWAVDVASGLVARDDEEARLEPKVMAVLVELARTPGVVRSKESLIEAVWPETYVGEAALARCISELRRALGDDARNPSYIETIPKRGYRLLARVEAGDDGTAEPDASGDDPVTESPGIVADRVESAHGDADPAIAHRAHWNRLAAGGLVLLLFAAWWFGGSPAGRSGPIESVAVLPLRALTDDASARMLAEGLGQQLATELASIDGLAVRGTEASRDTARTDRSLTEIANALGVDALVTGTVQVSGNRTLIALELIDAATQVDLWAGSYQEIDEDVLEIEREVAEQARREIAAALATRANGARARGPADPAALRALERGRVLAGRDRPADALRALSLFQEATRLDPGYAQAWAAAADLHATLAWNHWSETRDGYRQARTAAYSALDIDPRLPEAHAVLGAVAAEANWDWPEAERFFETSIELGPESAMAHERYGRYLRRLGRTEEALTRTGRAVELAPDWLAGQVSHGWSLLLGGRLDEASTTFLRAMEMDDDVGGAIEGLCAVAILADETESAIATCARAARLPGHDLAAGALGHALARAGQTRRAESLLLEISASGTPEALLAEATILVGLARPAEALEALRRAVDGRAIRAAAILADPYLRTLANEEGFDALLERMAIPTEGTP